MLLLIDVAESDEVSIDGDDNCEDKKNEKLRFKNLNKVTSYLISNVKQTFI